MTVHPAQNRPRPVLAGTPADLRLAVIGNYPPRRCGIATFTADMVDSLRGAGVDIAIDVYAMTRAGDDPAPPGVLCPIPETDRAAHARAGHAIEASGVHAVWVQHEFGIFGGEAGEWIIDLLEPIAAPIVVTLHTVLEQPSAAQERVMSWLAAHAARLVVMSHTARRILLARGDVDPAQVALIEHGAPDRPLGGGDAVRRRLCLPEDEAVLLTFGLLSPGKGIEVAIRALARVVGDHPRLCYVVAGVTHPRLVEREGEQYREELERLAASLGVAGNIRWINEYLDNDALIELIECADIYLTPYTGALQCTSGTLSYAVALGKAVISTPYVHAAELLGDGHGILTPFGDEAAMARAIGALLDDPARLAQLQARAHARGRVTVWPHFARLSLDLLAQVRPARRHLPGPTLLPDDDLERLCDGTGMIQHSVLGVPDRAHGYCVDDNARALILVQLGDGPFAERAYDFAAFVQYAWNPETGRFRNFMGFDRAWREAAGSDDSCGRTLWALGFTAGRGASDLRDWARRLWRISAAMALEFPEPRSLAFAALGADHLLETGPDPLAKAILERTLADFSTRLDLNAEPGWTWFEPFLAYDNCRLPEAMLRAARRLDDPGAAAQALAALDWIAQWQTAPAGHHRPVGSEAFGQPDRAWLPFDQQPVDAWATVDAAVLAFRHTGLPRWRRVAEQAHAWFFGANDRGLELALADRGGCQDGLTPRGVNLNRGAESVLALHLAAHALASLQSGTRGWRQDGLDAAPARGSSQLPG
jgi:glycosyltransferase involved in cell wall biosynthesis